MPHIRTDEAPIVVDEPALKGRYADHDENTTETVAALFVRFLETGVAPQGLFAPDVFCDLTLPHWRLQAEKPEGVSALRTQGHPWPGRLPRTRLDLTPTGFVLEVEEAWDQDGDPWCCRELMRADVVDGAISELSVYCTGDWDAARVAEHAAAVRLLRP